MSTLHDVAAWGARQRRTSPWRSWISFSDRMMEERSQKGARGVHVEDLAALIDQRRAAAVKEMRQRHG
jgi:hypothetical protein